MSFEVFGSYGAGSRDSATLRASGYLFVPRAMLVEIKAADATELVLLYDRKESWLAIRAASKDDPQNVRREVIREKSGSVVNIVPLLRSYRLPQPKRKVRLTTWIDEASPMIVMDMNELPDPTLPHPDAMADSDANEQPRDIKAQAEPAMASDREDFDDDIPF